MWILSITILAESKVGSNSKYYTFPIAIGEKNSSHEEILNMYYKELSELYKNPVKVFDGRKNCDMNVRITKLLSIADSPERRSSNFIMLGGGTYSARWGYGVNVKEMCNTLPSCERCFETLISKKNSSSSQECIQCCNWNFTGNFKVSTDYPNDKLDEYNNMSIPCELLSYEELIIF